MQPISIVHDHLLARGVYLNKANLSNDSENLMRQSGGIIHYVTCCYDVIVPLNGLSHWSFLDRVACRL